VRLLVNPCTTCDRTKSATRRTPLLGGWPDRHHRLAPPTLGQHNDEVLRGLGLTDDEIENLRAHHVIGETALNA